MPSHKPVWLDCDPGHDDAVALLLALHSPSDAASPSSSPAALELLGVSTVAGNAPGLHTHANAARLLVAFGAPDVPLVRGADEPIVRQRRSDPAIHGEDGLGGVECLPPRDSSEVKALLGPSQPSPLGFVTRLVALLTERASAGLPKLHLIATGPLTNIALLLKLAPHSLIASGVEQIVLMGGAAGCPGNRSPLAEFNILVDPEAASIVFSYNIKVVMAGLNVTHRAIFTPRLLERLDGPSETRKLLASAMTFFAKTYEEEFGFKEGPPVHDMLAVAYVIDPSLFHDEKGRAPKRYHVRVDTNDGLGLGATVVDFHSQLGKRGEDVWYAEGRNVEVLEALDCDRLWELFFAAVDRAERAARPAN